MSHSVENKDDIVNQRIRHMRLLILCVCGLGLTGWVSLVCQGQDMSVEEVLRNLKTGRYSGKPVDIDLEDVRIEALFTRLEESSGLSFELSPNIPMQVSAKKTYRFKQVAWDRILSLVLREFHLEAIPKDGAVYVQPIEDNLMQIIREDQIQTPESSRFPAFLYFLAALILAGGTAGFLLYRRKAKTGDTSSRGFGIDPGKADEVMKKVVYLFEIEKVFRREDISLQSLSEKLAIPSYQLSWIINKKMNATFSGLVNSYRVDEVKKRLTSAQDADKNILEIAFDAGFNTKTSFNRVFKRLTRMTPSQYRRRYKVTN